VIVKTLSLETPEALRPLLTPGLRYYGCYGGRGSSKSWFFASKIVEECIAVPGTRVVCVREVQKTLKESAKRLIEDTINALDVAPMFTIRRDDIGTPGGGIIIFQGLQDFSSESIKSLEGFRIAWVEEAQTMSSRSLEMLRPTIRSPGSALYFSWNPRDASDPVDRFFKSETPPPDSVCVKINYDQNPFFPPELEMERQHDKITNPHRYGHIWLGEYAPQAIGALWTRQMFHDSRRTRESLPKMGRILVAIDPAISSEPESDEHGIIVAGLGEDQRAYVLEDGSLKGTPQQWGSRAVSLFDKWDADALVIERNQGGDMVREVLRTIRPGLPVIEVHATRGKHVRAEPIAAMYAAGRVSHVGTYPKLEDQCCLITASGYEGNGSPDRADAMVWAMTQLFPSIVNKPAPPRVVPLPVAHHWR
jgi:phage terminase large subunit-like protein